MPSQMVAHQADIIRNPSLWGLALLGTALGISDRNSGEPATVIFRDRLIDRLYQGQSVEAIDRPKDKRDCRSTVRKILPSGLGLAVILIAALLVSPLSVTPAEANSRYAAVVMDAKTGEVRFARGGKRQRYPASLTKVMTLYMVFDAVESGKLTFDQKLTVSARAAGRPPSKLGLKKGEKITVEQAVRALVVRSANDVATVVAESLAETEFKFALEMTKKARSIGLKRTTFRNASGLHNRRQVTTATDMAMLARRMEQDFPQHFHYFTLTSFEWKGRKWRSHNKLLKNYAPADGLKTGYTRASGFNLITTARQDNIRLIGVVMGGRTANRRDREMKRILNLTFSRLRKEPAYARPLAPRLPTIVAKPDFDAIEAMRMEEFARTGMPRPKPFGAEDELQDAPQTNKTASPKKNTIAAGDPIAEIIRGEDGIEEGSTSHETGDAVSESAPGFDMGDGGQPEKIASAGDWAVQVGAFSTTALADIHLKNAADMLPELLPRRLAAIMTTGSGNKTIYRARFGPMTESQAKTACKKLKNNGVRCLALRGRDWGDAIRRW